MVREEWLGKRVVPGERSERRGAAEVAERRQSRRGSGALILPVMNVPDRPAVAFSVL